MEQPVITLVELPPTLHGKLNGPPAQDVYHGFKLPDRANRLLQAILFKKGYKNVANIDPKNIRKSSKLTARDFKRIFSSDYLLLSSITRTIPQTRELSLKYKQVNPQGTVIAGGPHVTFTPEETLSWADIVIRHEGDKTLPELINKLEEENSPQGVKGISYKKDGQIIHEKKRPFLTPNELSSLPLPRRRKKSRIKVETIINSRGCPFSCEFCSVSLFYGRRYRRRNLSSTIKELKELQKYPQKSVFIADDNFVGESKKDVENTKELLREMIRLKLNNKRYVAQLSISAAFDSELLSLLKEAGIFAICVGVESINPKTLAAYKKPATSQKNKEGVKRFKKAGLWVHGMMIVGGEGDTEKSLQHTLDWTKKNLDSVQFFAPGPLPGTPFTKKMKEQDRIITKDYSLYDGVHVIVRPKKIHPYKLQKMIFNMHRKFYSFSLPFRPRQFIRKLITDAYGRYTTHSVYSSSPTQEHLRFLKSLN